MIKIDEELNRVEIRSKIKRFSEHSHAIARAGHRRVEEGMRARQPPH